LCNRALRRLHGYECIEVGKHGRDEIVELGRKLARFTVNW
jgi:hypothetical protein